MPDHDWDGDGRAGGSAGAGGGADRQSGREGAGPRGISGTRAVSDSRTASDTGAASDTPAANVVPFPGNWFGSIDELVPIHPEPAAPRLTAVAPVATPPPDSTPDASAFWDGEAAPLQEVLAVPAHLQSAEAAGPPLEEASVQQEGEPRHRRRLRAPALATIVLTAAAAAALVVVQALPSGRGALATHDHGLTAAAGDRPNSKVVTQTVTSPAITVTTKPRAHTGRHGPRSGTRRTKRSATSRPVSTTANGTSTVDRASTGDGASTGNGASAGNGASISTGASTSTKASTAQQPSTSDLAASHSTSSSDSVSPPASTSRNSADSGPHCAGAQSPNSGCLP